MSDYARIIRLEKALLDMARLVPETCRYHGERLDAPTSSIGRQYCCDSGRVPFHRRQILQRLEGGEA